MISYVDSRIELRMGLRNQLRSARNRLESFHDKQVKDELTFKDARMFMVDFKIIRDWMESSCYGLRADIANNGKMGMMGGLDSDDIQLIEAKQMLKVLSFNIDKLKKVQEIMREEIKI